jgi:hypothetical protein
MSSPAIQVFVAIRAVLRHRFDTSSSGAAECVQTLNSIALSVLRAGSGFRASHNLCYRANAASAADAAGQVTGTPSVQLLPVDCCCCVGDGVCLRLGSLVSACFRCCFYLFPLLLVLL